MKFLGIRNGHDCNLTYTNGSSVRYIKLERNFQEKHYNWHHRPGDDMSYILEEAERIWGLKFDDLDGICLSNDYGMHQLTRSLQINELAFQVNTKENPFWAQFGCPVFQIDHHYSHMLSCWPQVDVQLVDTHFVFDGLGDHGRVSAVFQNYAHEALPRLVDYIDRSENLGLSVTMERIGEQYGMHGSVLDMSGKLMALKSYHKVPKSLVDQVMSIATPLRYRHLNQFINIIEQVQNQTHRGDQKQRLVDLAYFLHVFGEQKLPDYFELYAGYDDVITYSGGTAQNTVVNSALKARFPKMIIPPHCPDDGLSLGCVEYLRQHFDQPTFDNSGFPYWQSDVAPTERPSSRTVNDTAELLAQGKIVGWYQGHGEIGPRALGNRSILMDPSLANGKDIINAKVKHREPYRPFGASILNEERENYFDCNYESPYMLYVINCHRPADFPAIVHVDGSCRIQTVGTLPQEADYRRVLEAFQSRTGVPMLLNTSLNVDGKPIAGSPDDAKTLLTNSELDALVIGNDIIK